MPKEKSAFYKLNLTWQSRMTQKICSFLAHRQKYKYVHFGRQIRNWTNNNVNNFARSLFKRDFQACWFYDSCSLGQICHILVCNSSNSNSSSSEAKDTQHRGSFDSATTSLFAWRVRFSRKAPPFARSMGCFCKKKVLPGSLLSKGSEVRFLTRKISG